MFTAGPRRKPLEATVPGDRYPSMAATFTTRPNHGPSEATAASDREKPMPGRADYFDDTLPRPGTPVTRQSNAEIDDLGSSVSPEYNDSRFFGVP